MMKFFTAYKVSFSRQELGLLEGDLTGNPYLGNGRGDKYKIGSHISEETDDELRSTRCKFPIDLTKFLTFTRVLLQE